MNQYHPSFQSVFLKRRREENDDEWVSSDWCWRLDLLIAHTLQGFWRLWLANIIFLKGRYLSWLISFISLSVPSLFVMSWLVTRSWKFRSFWTVLENKRGKEKMNEWLTDLSSDLLRHRARPYWTWSNPSCSFPPCMCFFFSFRKKKRREKKRVGRIGNERKESENPLKHSSNGSETTHNQTNDSG